eukprot:jgi/Chrpa1/9877/Chrysochromulina_OHIO_Genome00009176-RA
MSFRELRNFKEIMCTLGYPRLISIENFKVPHFELVADILVWLCHRYDKNLEILDEIRTENDRVAFLKSVAEQLLVKARVKLNLKNLYSSNGFAVRELLKVAQLLYEAHKNAAADAEEGDETLPADIGPGHKFADVKLTRSLAADITKYGARLHELLGRHAEAKESASRALGKNFDVDYLQRQLHEMVSQVTEQTEQMRGMLANLEADEANLQQKIDKRKQELDRHQKRLASLQTVRPAFMDEYERLEGELSVQYSMYVQAWRNLSYLESELDAIHALEEERIAENDRQMHQMQRRLREEELRILRGQTKQTKVDERALDEALMTGDGDERAKAIKRPGAATTRRDGRGGSGGGDDFGNGGGMYGAMAPLDDEEEEEEDEDEDEDEDGDGQGGEDENDEDSDGQVEFTHEGAGGLGDSAEVDGEFGEEDDEDDEEDNDF